MPKNQEPNVWSGDARTPWAWIAFWAVVGIALIVDLLPMIIQTLRSCN